MKRADAVYYAKELVKKVLDLMDYNEDFRSAISSVNVQITDDLCVEDRKDVELSKNILDALAEFVFPEDSEN